MTGQGNPSAPKDPQFPLEQQQPVGFPRDRDPEADSAAASPASEPADAAPEGAILSYEPVAGSGAPVPSNSYPEVTPPGPQLTRGSRNRALDFDLRVPWGWLDLLLLVVVWIGVTAISTILFAIIFASQGIAFSQIQHSPRYLGFFVVADQVVVSIAVLLFLWLQARVRFNSPFWPTLGWRRFETGQRPRALAYAGFVALGCILALSVQLVSAEFPAKGKLPIENFLQNRQVALALMIMSVVLAPVVEETVFRGYIYPVVARTFGIAAGIVGTGTVFGLLHAEQLWGGWAQIALLVFVGIVFTWVRAAKRTVLASYFLHVSYNSFLFLAFLVSSQGFRSLH